MKNLFVLTIMIFWMFGAICQEPQKYAVLITGDFLAGGISNNNEKWNNGTGLEPGNGFNEFWNDTYLFWKLLYDNNDYSNDNIFLLFANGDDYFETHPWVDNAYRPNSYGFDYITDYSSEQNNIQTLFTNTLSGITENDFLFVWVMSHGGTDATGSYFYSYDAQKIYDSQLATWLNGINAHKKTVFLSFPSSGGFLKELEGERTTIILDDEVI
jgi:hypothetical protein